MKKIVLLFMLFSLAGAVCFSQNSSNNDSNTNSTAQNEKFDKDFPQWAKDLRRTEIITLGSLPFVTIWTTVLYSLTVYGEMTNPMDRNTSSFTEDDQWKIIGFSLGTCAALGVTDLVISLIKRHSNESKAKKTFKYREIQITPILPEVELDKSYLEIEGIESAVF